MIIKSKSTFILSHITKINKTPKPSNSIFFNLLSLSRSIPIKPSFFSSSSDDHASEIPAKLRHKDWLSPTQIHRLFASIQNPRTIVSALDHYSKRKDYKPNEALFSLILDRLARAGLFSDAEAVFRRVTSQKQCRLSDEFFRCAIGVFGAEMAVEILFDMPGKYGSWPSTETFNAVLDLLVSARMFRTVHEVFVAAPKLGVAIDSRSLNVMVRGLCKFGRLDVALQVLDEFPQLNCKPDSETFATLVRYFSADGRVDEAFGLFGKMEREGVEPDTSVYNALIGGLQSRGRVDDGIAVFERMRLEGCDPDVESYREVFSGLVGAGRFHDAKVIMRKAIATGVIPSFEAYKSLIRGLCEENRMEDVGWVLEEMVRQEFVPNLGMWRVILESLFDRKSNHIYIDAYEEITAN